jgi:hypothetical protein
MYIVEIQTDSRFCFTNLFACIIFPQSCLNTYRVQTKGSVGKCLTSCSETKTCVETDYQLPSYMWRRDRTVLRRRNYLKVDVSGCCLIERVYEFEFTVVSLRPSSLGWLSPLSLHHHHHHPITHASAIRKTKNQRHSQHTIAPHQSDPSNAMAPLAVRQIAQR